MQWISNSVRVACLLPFLAGQVQAENDVIDSRLMTLGLASQVAAAAVQSCAESGYQVSAVVVDRSGVPQVVMRDVFASRFNTELAQRKANAAILAGTSTSELSRNRADIRAELNELEDVLVLAGAVPIRAAGSLLGAVGVSGAPGGDKDEACARAGVERIQETLDFIE